MTTSIIANSPAFSGRESDDDRIDGISSTKTVRLPNKKRQRLPMATWLKKRTSDLDHGMKGRIKPFHVNTNETIIAKLERRVRFVDVMNHYQFGQHFSGAETYYFAGNDRSDESLEMIDVDCKDGVGSAVGSAAYSAHVKKKYLPNLYYEPSTGNIGSHGFFLVKTEDHTATEINDALKSLQTALRRLVSGFDISGVEVKGMCPVIEWERYQRGKVQNFKAGQLAKLPRDATRFDELEKTSVLTVDEIYALVNRIEKDTANGQQAHQSEAGLLPALGGRASLKPAQEPTTTPSTTRANPCRSITGKHIKIRPEHYRATKQLLNFKSRPTHNRVKIINEDIAVFLAIVEFCTINMNPDGTLPTARIKRLWEEAYKSGDAKRAWQDERYTAIRNWLSEMGLLDWQDETYSFGNGRGKACKWKATNELLCLMKERGEKREASFILSTFQPNPENVDLRPEIKIIKPIWWREEEEIFKLEQYAESICYQWAA
jgi:hypothetical protein